MERKRRKRISFIVLILIFVSVPIVWAQQSSSAFEGMRTSTISESRILNTADVLIIQNYWPWDSLADTVVLDSLGYSYSIATWTDIDNGIVDIYNYPAILLVNDQDDAYYSAYASHVTAIETYVSSGHTLIFFAADWGWNAGTLTAPLPGGVSYNQLSSLNNYIENSTHPIVTAENSDSIPLTDSDLIGNACSHGYFTNLAGDTGVILRETDAGGPTLIEYPLGSGHVIASTLTWEWAYYLSASYPFALKALDDLFLYALGSKKWTFMVYLDADNDLEKFGINDFLEMAQVGSDSNVNIVVQFDRKSGGQGDDDRYGNWTSTKRFYVTQNLTPESANAVMDLNEVNMGDPQSIIDFVNWSKTNYPAQNYALVLWNHGSGWKESSVEKIPLKAVCEDETDNDILWMNEVGNALNTIGNVDLIGFDACLMGMVEVAYEIKDYGQVMVGSEETEPGYGWPYNTVLQALVNNPDWTPAQFGSSIVDKYYDWYVANYTYWNDYTQSALDLTKLDSLAAAIDTFSGKMMTDWNSNRIPIGIAARNVMSEIDNVVINHKEGTDYPDAHGIAIYFPEDNSDFDSSFYKGSWIKFPKDTQWEEFLQAFYNNMDGFWVDYLRVNTQEFYTPEHIDLYHLCKLVSQASSYLPVFHGNDFTNNGKSDITIFRPSSGYWYVKGGSYVEWGKKLGDIPVPGDYNGDGETEIAVYRPGKGTLALTTGWWYIKDGSTVRYGIQVGDIPIPGDYNGDGKTDIAIYRPANGYWYLRGISSVQWGIELGDVPVPADYNNDGTTDIAVYRPSNGCWYIKGIGNYTWGIQPGDVPVPGDYNGDNNTDIAVYRPSNGYWYIRGVGNYQWGIQPGDIPVPTDYNGDGNTDIAVYRPSNGYWYIRGVGNYQWGIQQGDIPVTRGVK